MHVLRYGDQGVYVDLEVAHAPDRATRTLAYANVLRNRFPSADIVVGGGVITLIGVVDVEKVSAALNETIVDDKTSLSHRNHIVPIVFDGPDVDDVANLLTMPREEIVESLVKTDFLVELMGFLPGFGYLGQLDKRLMMPRRKNPRPRVPASSLGIAGEFAGIYPFVSPGGWHLLGRSVGPALFDAYRDEPFLFAPGDHVRFESFVATDVPAAEPNRAAVAMDALDKPGFIVEFAPACATIQDVGRWGRLHAGLSASGPLDPDSFFAANLAVGNEPGEAAIEIPLGKLVLRAQHDLVVSVDGAEPISLKDGERFTLPENDRAVRYLAFRGGIDVPNVLGSRSTLLVARLGGFSGRPLRKGDIVPLSDRAVTELIPSDRTPIEMGKSTMIVVDPGPHRDRFPENALDVLLSATYSISTLGDRVGVRLDGPKIPRTGGDSALPVPMIRGAMQIATDGTPIVFGPDHPTTGGYPVLAVVRRSSWGSLARLRPGKTLRFIL